MGRKLFLTEAKRALIVVFHKDAYTERETGIRLTSSKTAFYQAIAKSMKFGLYKERKRLGRPKKPTRRQSHKAHGCATASVFVKETSFVMIERGSEISVKTVRHRLDKEFGLRSRKPSRKLHLTPTMKAKRLAFAKSTSHSRRSKNNKCSFRMNLPSNNLSAESAVLEDLWVNGIMAVTLRQP